MYVHSSEKRAAMVGAALSLAYCLLAFCSVKCVESSKVSVDHVNITVNVTTQEPAITKNTANHTLSSLNLDGSMIQRALYVLIGITIIGVLYFLVRAVRLKKSSTTRKKYGLLANYDDTVEMAQLESDEDDNTVYEAKSLRR